MKEPIGEPLKRLTPWDLSRPRLQPRPRPSSTRPGPKQPRLSTQHPAPSPGSAAPSPGSTASQHDPRGGHLCGQLHHHRPGGVWAVGARLLRWAAGRRWSLITRLPGRDSQVWRCQLIGLAWRCSGFINASDKVFRFSSLVYRYYSI